MQMHNALCSLPLCTRCGQTCSQRRPINKPSQAQRRFGIYFVFADDKHVTRKTLRLKRRKRERASVIRCSLRIIWLNVKRLSSVARGLYYTNSSVLVTSDLGAVFMCVGAHAHGPARGAWRLQVVALLS